MAALATKCTSCKIILNSYPVTSIGVNTIWQKRHNSTNSLTSYKRGRGGRSSFSGIVATVFGATGQLGRCVVTRLGRIGSQVIIPYRCDFYYVNSLKLCGDLGQILFQEYNLRDEESIRKSIKYSNVVINAIGLNWETKNFKYADIYEHGPRLLARLSREMGVSKFIHVSDINSNHNPPCIHTRHGSPFLKAKARGEDAVREEFPSAIIIRPADMFGPEDKFMHYWSARKRRYLNNVPVWKKGMQTIKQPVLTFDVAEGIIKAITDSDVDGKIIQAVGPYRYYLGDIINYFYEIMQWDEKPLVNMHPFMWLKAFINQHHPQEALLSLDKMEREVISDHVDPLLPTLKDLDVSLTRMEDRAYYEVWPYRKISYYDHIVGQFPEARPPPIVADRGYFE